MRWAELVNQLIPCAELTRFTMSGTEATHLAMRVARAFTGRPKIVKMAGHFHGWHDGAVAAVSPPYDVPWSAGVPTATIDQVVICPPNDIKAVELAFERGDIAARHPGARRRRLGDDADDPRLSRTSCARWPRATTWC